MFVSAHPPFQLPRFLWPGLPSDLQRNVWSSPPLALSSAVQAICVATLGTSSDALRTDAMRKVRSRTLVHTRSSRDVSTSRMSDVHRHRHRACVCMFLVCHVIMQTQTFRRGSTFLPRLGEGGLALARPPLPSGHLDMPGSTPHRRPDRARAVSRPIRLYREFHGSAARRAGSRRGRGGWPLLPAVPFPSVQRWRDRPCGGTGWVQEPGVGDRGGRRVAVRCAAACFSASGPRMQAARAGWWHNQINVHTVRVPTYRA
jgi:hypothetical protein